MRLPSLDIPRIVDLFGGPLGCSRACEEVGFSLPSSTPRKWLSRNRLPMDGWLMLNAAHEIKRGKSLNLNDYIVRKAK